VTTSLIMALAAPIAMTGRVYADKYDDQIQALQAEIDQAQAQAANLKNVANDLQSKIDSINIQITQIQAQITISQTQSNQLADKITDSKQKIKESQDGLGSILASLYVDDQVSPLEMLASSSNIGDYIDKQTYRSSAQDQLNSTIKIVKDLKTQLEKDQQAVKIVLTNQQTSEQALAGKQSEQASLLAATKGEQAAYEQIASKAQADQAAARDAQQAAIAAAIARTGGGRVIMSGAAPDYPWNNSNCAMGGPMGYYSYGGADGNGGDGHGYGCRQCASYAAWRVAKETGIYPTNWGNAANFPANARGVFATGFTPRANSLAVMSAATSGASEGHIVWVDAVNDDGTLTVEQYNYNYGAGYGMYSQMRLSAQIFDLGYIYIK
jgi:peptidoglycan hydrolase CwlO-like protein